MMKADFRFLLAVSLLVSAPALADYKEFSTFLEDYKAYRSKRDIESKNHNAGFSGRLVFKECRNFYFYDGGSCECPPGNNYLQCLVSAKATIKVDRNDIQGKGYVLVVAGDSVLDNKGNWVPMNTKGAYTLVIDPLEASHEFNVAVPRPDVIERVCANNAGEKIPISVGYGAAMPMDIRFAKRMKDEAARLDQTFDEDKFIYTRARTDGTRAKKYGTVGVVRCRPNHSPVD